MHPFAGIRAIRTMRKPVNFIRNIVSVSITVILVAIVWKLIIDQIIYLQLIWLVITAYQRSDDDKNFAIESQFCNLVTISDEVNVFRTRPETHKDKFRSAFRYEMLTIDRNVCLNLHSKITFFFALNKFAFLNRYA